MGASLDAPIRFGEYSYMRESRKTSAATSRLVTPPKRVALVIDTRLENSASILRAIYRENERQERWLFYLDDHAVCLTSPDWLTTINDWAGIIAKNPSESLINACLEKSIPMVALEDSCSSIHPGIPVICPDNRAIGHCLAEYFIDSKCKYFGFVGIEGSAASRERWEGYSEALSLVGAKSYYYSSSLSSEQCSIWHQDEESGLADWLNTLPKPVSIMTCSALSGYQVICACRRSNLIVPEEVAVVCVNNDSHICEQSFPALSNLPVDMESYGKLAVQHLSGLLQKHNNMPELSFIAPDHIVSRRSSDPIEVSDASVSKAIDLITVHGVQF